MTKVVAIMSMSLDGYVADANDGVAEVFDWYRPSSGIRQSSPVWVSRICAIPCTRRSPSG